MTRGSAVSSASRTGTLRTLKLTGAAEGQRTHGLHMALDDDLRERVEANGGVLIEADDFAFRLVHRGFSCMLAGSTTRMKGWPGESWSPP